MEESAERNFERNFLNNRQPLKSPWAACVAIAHNMAAFKLMHLSALSEYLI